MKRIFGAIAVPLLIISLSACASKKMQISPDVASSDEALFKEGEKYIKKSPEKARLYMQQVIDLFPRSFYAQRAKLAIADSYFAQGDEGSMILAANEYRNFISLYPYSPSAPYAMYRVGLCSYEKILKPGRDQQKTVEALAEFKKVISAYPLSEEAKLARDKIKDCEGHLAEHTFGIGLQYYRMKAYKAAIDRLGEILTNYPDYAELDRVYFYIAESYFDSGKFDESVPYFTKLVTDYPKSKYARKAQKRLSKIRTATLIKKK
jgi:outer membrane protein assembly factor BamD